MTTLTTKTISATFVLAAILTTGIGLGIAEAETDLSLTEEQISEIASFRFSSDKEQEFKTIAQSNPFVRSELNDKDIIFEGVGVGGNLKNPDKKLAVVHYLTLEKTVSVVIDEQSKEIVEIGTDVPRKLVTDNAFAVSQYSGGENIEGVQMILDMLSYSHQEDAEYTGIVLNAAKSGSNTANLCDWNNAPDDYWMQSGIVFDADGRDVVWADTITNCLAIDATSLSWSTGNELRFRNYITDLSGTANDYVTAYIYNLDNDDYYSYSRNVADTETFLTDDNHTSVFFENSHEDDSVAWEDGFSSEELTVTSAEIRNTTSSTYDTWDDSDHVSANCGGITGPAALMDDQFDSSPIK